MDRKSENLPLVSIIVPMYNAETTIKRCLDRIFNLNYPKERLEIFLSDDGSTDRTIEYCKKIIKKVSDKEKYSRLSLLKNKQNRGVSVARNRGLKNASGEFIMFIDSDIVVKKDTLKALLYHFKEEKIGGVAAVCPFETKDIISDYYESWKSYADKNNIIENVELGTGATIYKSTAIEGIKFDENIRIPSLEDADFCLYVLERGYKTLQDNNITVYHLRRSSILKEINVIYRKGFVFLLLLIKHPQKMKTVKKSVLMQLFFATSFFIMPLSFLYYYFVFPFLFFCTMFFVKSYLSLKKRRVKYSFIGLLLRLSHAIGLFLGLLKWRKEILSANKNL
jgi:glycosyltransferase involved in cell wall biosynthesis